MPGPKWTRSEWIWLSASGIVGALLSTSCAAAPGDAVQVLEASNPARLVDSVPCDPNTGFNFTKCWVGNSSVSIKVPTSVPETDYNQILRAVGDWNRLLQEGTFGAPRLTLGRGTGGNVNIAFASTSLNGYCGAISGSMQQYTLTLYPPSHARCFNSPIGTVEQVARHELAHIVGWTDGAEGLQVAGVSDHCALNNAGLMFRDQVCLHEVEGAFRAYRGIGVPVNFWSTGILKQTNLDTNRIAIQPGQSRQLSVSAFSSRPPESYDLTLPAPATRLTFTSNAPTIASVSAAGLVTALATGSSRISVSGKPSQIPAGMLLWSPNEVTGDTVRVVVSPDTLLRITNVTSVGAPPFTTGGQKTFTATVLGAMPTPAVQVAWRVHFSFNGASVWDSTLGGPTYALTIPGGSYRLDVWARPVQGQKLGAAYQSSWPVCTPETPLRLPQPNRPGGC